MNELEDIKLKALLRRMELDAPEPNFSVRVMNKIFEESSALEKIKSEKILGKGFWIIMILFIALLAMVFFMHSTGNHADSQLQSIIPEINSGVTESYDSFFSKLGSFPLAIGAIMAAFSVLIFFDHFISSNSKVFA